MNEPNSITLRRRTDARILHTRFAIFAIFAVDAKQREERRRRNACEKTPCVGSVAKRGVFGYSPAGWRRSSKTRFCRSAGLMPGIWPACASVDGRMRVNFWRASIEIVRMA